MNAMRKGWCPGALRPMRSGDGWLVRLRFSCGEVSLAHAREIAALAGRFGNGEIDLTARAHLQLRGVEDAGYPGLMDRLAEAGLVDGSPEGEAVRNVLVSPLAGFDGPFDVRPYARAWERALASSPGLWRLPGKFGVAFDAGSLPLGDDSDIRFEARAGETFVARLAGATPVLGPFPADKVVAVAHALAEAFLGGETPPRMRDAVRASGLAPFAVATGLPSDDAPAPQAARAADWLGAHVTSQGAFVGIAAPFGRLHASQLGALADLAQEAGAAGMRLTPWRALLIPGVSERQGRALALQARGLGLIVDADEKLLRVAACAGAPACSSALQETRETARRLAAFAPRGEGVWLHVSGCAKGCAHPRPAPVTVVATREGYQLNGEAARSLEALAERIVA